MPDITKELLFSVAAIRKKSKIRSPFGGLRKQIACEDLRNDSQTAH
jgi:hypothetical protein